MIPAAIKLARPLFWIELVLFLACSSAPASASSAWFTRVWQTDDGLLNNNIPAIAQGPDDYLWVVTPAGLMRFDGVSFSRFPIKDLAGPIEPRIRTVLCSRRGVLWFVPFHEMVFGLKPDYSTVTLQQTGLPPNPPAALAEEGDGSLWLAYPGAIYRIKNGQVAKFAEKEGMPPGDLYSFASDGAGNVWLAKGDQICVFRSGRFQQAASVQGGVQCMAATPGNAVWFVAMAHLFACDTGGTLRDYGAFQDASGARAKTLLEDHAGAVWIGTDGNGLFRYSKSGFERVETSHSCIMSLAEDREGNIWASTAGGGLDRVSLSGAEREVLGKNPTLGQMESICEDAHGVLWGATKNGALVSRSNGEWNPSYTNASFAGTVRCVAADRNGAVWIGTRNGKLLHLVNTNWTTCDQNSGMTNRPVAALLPTSAGDLWIVVGDHTLQCLHNGHLRVVSPPRQIKGISALAEDATGNIWVGAHGTLMRFDGKDFVDESPRLPNFDHNICCLYATPDGSMWVSYGGIGLLRFKDGHIGQIGSEQGLFDDYISQIIADDHGWLWFASDHGIFKTRRQELEQAMDDHSIHLRPIVYGRNEGLISLAAVFCSDLPYVLPRAIRTHDGRICLLMHTGVVVADPNVMPENVSASPALLTRVAMDDQTIAAYGDVGLPQTVAHLKTSNTPLRLPPGHRHLEFDFTAFHFSAPENIHFRYQLVGFDNDWIGVKKERTATYSRLTAGDYQFRVEACIGDGPWSETPATLGFTVAPFFWQTWLFRLGALALFTVFVIAIVRYISFRRLQAEMRLLEHRVALDKERTRIARDLHDDLGGSLNSVALTLDIMESKLATLESTNGKIQHCSTMVRRAAKSVDEIIWAINPRNDTLRYMLDYISQSAVEFLHAANIPCRVDIPDNIPDRMVSPEARHNLLLVVKEALNNVTRHARASKVMVRIAASGSQVTITIEDNGRGFERAPDNASSDGLRNMRQRMEEIGGEFQLDSRVDAGTRVAFLYSWPANNRQ